MSESFDNLAAFVAVARERSFTRAAAKLGVSQSALSQTIKGLEGRLGVRLLTRSTRSVLATEAGERLLRTLAPRFEEIEQELVALEALRDKPAGTIRITAGEHPAVSILQPALGRILPDHPDVNVEIVVDYGLTDIVAQGFDAGVDWVSRWPKTWWPSGSARTCEWPLSARQATLSAIPFLSYRRISPRTLHQPPIADLWRD